MRYKVHHPGAVLCDTTMLCDLHLYRPLLVYTINLAFYFRVEYSTVSRSPLAVALSLSSSAMTKEAVLLMIQTSISGQMWLHWVSWFYSGNQGFSGSSTLNFASLIFPRPLPIFQCAHTMGRVQNWPSWPAWGRGYSVIVASQAADYFYLQILMMSFSAIISIELFPTV